WGYSPAVPVRRRARVRILQLVIHGMRGRSGHGDDEPGGQEGLGDLGNGHATERGGDHGARERATVAHVRPTDAQTGSDVLLDLEHVLDLLVADPLVHVV